MSREVCLHLRSPWSATLDPHPARKPLLRQSPLLKATGADCGEVSVELAEAHLPLPELHYRNPHCHLDYPCRQGPVVMQASAGYRTKIDGVWVNVGSKCASADLDWLARDALRTLAFLSRLPRQ